MSVHKFEYQVLNAFRRYFESNKTKAYAWRNTQFKYAEQLFDIYVDSLDPAFYLALECKSVDTTSTTKLYFTQHFKISRGVHQIDRENTFLSLTGRNGYLVVEARRPKPLRSTAFFVPWRSVWYLYKNGYKGIEVEVITQAPSLDSANGKYDLTDDFVAWLYRSADRKYSKKHKWDKGG